MLIGSKTSARLHVTEAADLPSPAALLAATRAALLGTSDDHAAQNGSTDTPKQSKKARKSSGGGGVDDSVLVPEWVTRGESPLAHFSVGQSVRVVVLPRPKQGSTHAHHGGHHGGWEVSARQSRLAAAGDTASPVAAAAAPQPPLDFGSLSTGAVAAGVVTEAGDDYVWVALGPHVRGRLHALDASSDPSVLQTVTQRLGVGRVVGVRVAHVAPAAHTLDLTLLPSEPLVPIVSAATDASLQQQAASVAANGSAKRRAAASAVSTTTAQLVPAADIAACVQATQSSGGPKKGGKGAAAGDTAAALQALLPPGRLVMARVAGVGGSGVRLHLGGRVFGNVTLTDVHDAWVGNALAGLEENNFVRAAVLAVTPAQTSSATANSSAALPRIALTLRTSHGGCIPGETRGLCFREL